MTMPGTILVPSRALLCAAAGFVFGYGYFASLRRSVERYVAHRAWAGPLVGALGRGLATALFFGAVAEWGAGRLGRTRPWLAAPLLAALSGFLLARQLAVRSTRRAG